MNVLKNMGMWFWKNKIKMIVLIGIVGGGFYYWQQKNKDSEKQTSIKTVEVEKGNIEVLVSGSGQVEADSQVDLRPQVAGDGLDIVQVLVQNDQEVKEDEIIAVLDTEEALKLVRDARIDLGSSQIRQKQVEDESYRKTEEDKWKRQLQEAEISQRLNKLSDANEKLEDYYIRAPFDGIVTGLDAEVGDSVARDEILASVITKEMVAKISLNEIDAVKVVKGSEVKLTFSALNDVEVSGEISKMATIGVVSQGVVSYDAEVSFDADNAPGLKPGMSVEAEIIIESKSDIKIVPVAAIQTNQRGNGGEFVMVVPKDFSLEKAMEDLNKQQENDEDNKDRKNRNNGIMASFKRIPVTTGISDDVVIEIVGDVSEGEMILAQDMDSLRSSVMKSEGSANGKDGNKSLFPVGKGMGGGGGRK